MNVNSVFGGSLIAAGAVCALKGVVDCYRGKRNLGRAEIALGTLTALGGFIHTYIKNVEAVNEYAAKINMMNDLRLNGCHNQLTRGYAERKGYEIPSLTGQDIDRIGMSVVDGCKCIVSLTAQGINKMVQGGWSQNVLSQFSPSFSYQTATGENCYGILTPGVII